MSLDITNLADLDASQVEQNLLQIVQRLSEAHPTLDFRRGVLHDLLALPHAELSTQQQQNLARYQAARSLADILADPALADESIVDGVLSNWRISRGAGTAARGQVTVVLSAPTSVTIAAGAVFAADGKTFTADAAYTAKAEAEQINSATDRLLQALGSGQWAFVIDVTAAASGDAYRLKKDTLLVPAALPSGYLTSYATSDFSGGLDAESNSDLVDRLQQGIAARGPSNRTNLLAMLRAETDFARVVHSSIVGFGDAEMLRDQHTLWPGSLGGRVDWYIRTQEPLQQLAIRKTATLVDKQLDGGIWQLSVGRDEAPGFYEAVSIRRPGEIALGSFPILADVRSLDTRGEGFVPDLLNAVEGAYSRYQTAVFRFQDTLTDASALAIGATADYELTLSYLPQIDQLQDWIGSFENRAAAADVLVRAPVPCFLSLAASLAKSRLQSDPDLAAIKDALCRLINTTDFTGRLYAAQLQDVIHAYLPEGMSVGAIDMLGRLRLADGSRRYLRSSEVLVVPEEPSRLLSARTVQFFVSPESISLDVLSSIPVPR